ncbi:hypothetical protein UY3_15106 [Chelonia mydas]|uniref:Uncharacterized protein n=1 Tax=Chelonia mydas TaxID=8469 RepID=M7AXM4_CHEMY|nr:hypothetical protein UY3_15106 [Chelonia mydas]
MGERQPSIPRCEDVKTTVFIKLFRHSLSTGAKSKFKSESAPYNVSFKVLPRQLLTAVAYAAKKIGIVFTAVSRVLNDTFLAQK